MLTRKSKQEQRISRKKHNKKLKIKRSYKEKAWAREKKVERDEKQDTQRRWPAPCSRVV
jgi:hypothetical protein